MHNKDQKSLPSKSLGTGSQVPLIQGHHDLLYAVLCSDSNLCLACEVSGSFSFGVGKQQMFLNEEVPSVTDRIVHSESRGGGCDPGRSPS